MSILCPDPLIKKNSQTNSQHLKIAFILGTRPEAIKLAPLILETQSRPKIFSTTVINTGQHLEMAEEMLDFFGIKAELNLKAHSQNKTPDSLVGDILSKLSPKLLNLNPDLVIVQGDTASAYSGALTAFLQKTKLAHVEAGLRTNDFEQPFPEEAFRVMIDRLANLHFAATKNNKNFLLKEGISSNSIFVTGNTGIDSLNIALSKLKEGGMSFKNTLLKDFETHNGPKVLLTAHRRENLEVGFDHIAEAVIKISKQIPDIKFLIPLHPNPKVQNIFKSKLQNVNQVLLSSPLSYPELCFSLQISNLVLTDSGGLQEEAPSLEKPLLILRDKTERQEGIEAGFSKLVGCNTNNIIDGVTKALSEKFVFKSKNPFGDGLAAKRIAETLILKPEELLREVNSN